MLDDTATADKNPNYNGTRVRSSTEMLETKHEDTLKRDDAIPKTESSYTSQHLHGLRLLFTTIGFVGAIPELMHPTDKPWPDSIMIPTFLVNFEVPVVSTSLVAITNDLNAFSQTSWIVTGYLVTYTGEKRVREKPEGRVSNINQAS